MADKLVGGAIDPQTGMAYAFAESGRVFRYDWVQQVRSEKDRHEIRPVPGTAAREQEEPDS